MNDRRGTARFDRGMDVTQAQRATTRGVRSRVVKVGERKYVAYSAHDLFESRPDTARPGHFV